MPNTDHIIHLLEKEIAMCNKRMENKGYTKQTVHFVAGIERAIIIIKENRIKK